MNMAKNTSYGISLLKEWSIWLVGIQTLAIGLTGKLLTEELKCGYATTSQIAATVVGSISLICFLVSIVTAAHLLVSLPAYSVRYPEIEDGKDFLNNPAFDSPREWIKKISLLLLVGAEMYSFILGIIFFVGLILIITWKQVL